MTLGSGAPSGAALPSGGAKRAERESERERTNTEELKLSERCSTMEVQPSSLLCVVVGS